MARAAGLVAGNTSSDGVAIDGAFVERGDLTGGEAARQVLRDRRVQMAILETARGGLLRRGLAAYPVDAAIITNVSADHLGEHGVLDLETMTATKLVAARAVRATGHVVLFADDEGLMRGAVGITAPRILFALDEARVASHVAGGGVAYVLRAGALVRLAAGGAKVLVRVDEAPITAGGAARHNVKNALGAAALAYALGLPDEPVVAALRAFGAHDDDNPGRGALHTLPSGVRVLLDFGHNPAAAADLYAWARTLAGSARVLAVITQPGDRDDAAMTAFVRAAIDAGADELFVWETASLFRGRDEGAIRDALVAAARGAGLGAMRIATAADESSAVRSAIGRAHAGDVVVVSPSLDRSIPGDA
jgi:UDP-N-acetylmuramyl tripeptide synthase